MTPHHTQNFERGGPKESPPIPEVDITKIPSLLDIGISPPLSGELFLNEVLPGLVRGQSTALLIDAANLYKRAEAEGFRIDYGKLKAIISSRCDLRYMAVFTAIDSDDENAIRWIRYLESNGITVFTKELKRFDDPTKKPKGNMDVDITIEAGKLSPHAAHVIIGTCDSDFIRLVKELKGDTFRTVSIMGVGNELSNNISNDLIASADHFYDLLKIRGYIENTGNRK